MLKTFRELSEIIFNITFAVMFWGFIILLVYVLHAEGVLPNIFSKL